jgi:lipoyl-dependent peroxiredoxin
LEALYIAVAEVEGGRQGQARALDGKAFELTLPAELDGSGTGTNPEQLLAVAYGAAFGSALDLEARQLGLDLRKISVACSVSFGHGDDGGYALEIDLRVRLPEVDAATAGRLLRAAEGTCPYCRMARRKIDLRIALA